MDLPAAAEQAQHGRHHPDEQFIDAKGKHVIILGGGDTGADCLGTAQRQGAPASSNSSFFPRRPKSARGNALALALALADDLPHQLRPRGSRPTRYGGDVRDFAINTKSFSGENGVVKKLHGIRLEWAKDAPRPISR
jgi:glutamate synthase (NADPH/NADH) small chain